MRVVRDRDQSQKPKCRARHNPLRPNSPKVSTDVLLDFTSASIDLHWTMARIMRMRLVACRRQAANVQGGMGCMRLKAVPADEMAMMEKGSTMYAFRGVV